MKVKHVFSVLAISMSFAACDGGGGGGILPDPTPGGGSGSGGGPVTSAKGKIAYVGQVEMEEGPHNLIVADAHLYAKRDNFIYQLSLSNPRRPSIARTYTSSSAIGNIYVKGSRLYAPLNGENAILELDLNLNLIKKHELEVAGFKPHSIWIDVEGNMWIGGSDGSNGILAKHSFTAGSLSLLEQWRAAYMNSNIESIAEKGSHILVSIPKGDILSFNKSSFSSGPVQTLTFTHEAGHEKWGRTILTLGNTAYWANWGAGMATVNIANPAAMEITKILSNSKFKSQFADAEGTNVYDIAHNTTHNLLCIANGWSGVLLINPAQPDQVVDFIDLQYFQNRCIATIGNYIYTGNISGGMSGDLKGIQIFEIK